jgi:hypothetical protein
MFFIFAHSEDDDECGNNFIANGGIFNMPSLSTLLLMLFSTILLPPLTFVCAHYFTFHFPLQFYVVS